MCQMELDPSSETKSEPSNPVVTPTGRPHTSPVGKHEAGKEVFVFAGGMAVHGWKTDDLITGAALPVP